MQTSIDAKVQELESSLAKANNARFSFLFETDGRIVEAEIFKDIQLPFWAVQLFNGVAVYAAWGSQTFKASTLSEAFKQLDRWLPGGALISNTLKLSICGGKPEPQSELSKVTNNVVSDYFPRSGIAVPDRAMNDPELARQLVFRECLGKALSGNPINIDSWNKRSPYEKKLATWHNTQLADKNLTGIDISHLDFQKSNFNSSKMSKANLSLADLQECTFRDTNLEKANLQYANLKDSDFTGANLRGAKISHASLSGINLTKADLSAAVLKECDLMGVDLTTCTTKGATFDKSKYDQDTKMPADFEAIGVMQWAGSGPNPYEDLCQKMIEKTSLAKFEELIPYLRVHFDKAKINKVVSMLKAESFQLFAEVEPEQVFGVVKSQTDPDLVYSCVLGTDGQFWCCTQNLRICGGLKGSVCKHILVLAIGLAGAGQLDVSKTTQWILRSKLGDKKPKLDKEKATSIFLKYKGAEASEVDWRPTETVPEDFYSY